MITQEGMKFDVSDTGTTLKIYFNTPTEPEIQQFKSDKPLKIRLIVLEDIIFITAKIGNLEWMDAPYTPHLSKNLTTLQELKEGLGYNLVLELIDNVSLTTKSLRLLGLSTKFSQELKKAILEIQESDFDVLEHQKNINKIYNKYTTKELSNMSKIYCNFN